jgi:hypothetical protein
LGRTPRPEEAQVHEKLVDTSIHRSRNDHVRDGGATSERESFDDDTRWLQNRFPRQNERYAHQRNGAGGSSVTNWTEMVTVQIFYALKATPAQFKIGIDKEGHAFMSRPLTPPLRDPD